jgi:predicted ATPase
MDYLRIKRLRSLSDTQEIQISPITVLLGRNSSGKSTFLRTFSLLKQSVESRTTGPILWYGRLVDFGSFEEAHQHGSSEGIEFDFGFKLNSNNDNFVFYGIENKILGELDVKVSIQLIENKKKVTRLKKMIIELSDSTITLEFEIDSEKVSRFQVNDLDILSITNDADYIARQSGSQSILPGIFEKEKKSQEKTRNLYFNSIFYNFHDRRKLFSLSNILLKKIQDRHHHKSANTTILKTYASFKIGSSEDMLKSLQDYKGAGEFWKKSLSSWSLKSSAFKEIKNLIIAESVPWIIEVFDDYIASFSRRVTYIGPVRATAERYYRIQDLAVNELDYQGQNLAMFLRSLKEAEMDEFRNWLGVNFGFEVFLKSGMGHLSITIKTKDSKNEVNVADTGFGFSQILPIITQLWLISESKQSNNIQSRRHRGHPITFAIEQPELHLHPHLQGLLAEIIVKSIRNAQENSIDLRLIIETHSESIINRLGHLISEKEAKPEDINIVIFEPGEDNSQNWTRKVLFDQDGYLKNWPIGFFSIAL